MEKIRTELTARTGVANSSEKNREEILSLYVIYGEKEYVGLVKR